MNMRRIMLSALMMLVGMASLAGEKLTLEEITSGVFRQDYMQAVRPMADGETYSQISDDGKQVVTYSFRTGKQVSVLFDAATTRTAERRRSAADTSILARRQSDSLRQTEQYLSGEVALRQCGESGDERRQME